MPRPVRPWFRFYVEAVSDRKLRRLSPAQRWLWVAMLAAARQSVVPGLLLVSEMDPMDENDLADIAGVPVKDVQTALPIMARCGMIEPDEATGAWRVAKWWERQFESDNTTERTAKHRSKHNGRNVPTSEVGTPPETETETETETDLLTSTSPLASSTDPPDGRIGRRIWEAALVLGHREAARRRADYPEPYARSLIPKLQAAHSAEWRRLLDHQPDLTAEQLADRTGPRDPTPSVDATQTLIDSLEHAERAKPPARPSTIANLGRHRPEDAA